MTSGAIFWLILFALSAMLFFAIAAVVAVRGAGDLRELLRKSSRRSQ
jgi:hypothetical protein